MPVLRPSGSDFTSFVKAAAQYVPAGSSAKVSKSGGVSVALPGLGAVVRTSQVGALASPTTSAVVINGVTPPASSGGPTRTPVSTTFTFTGALQPYLAPAGATTATIFMWGAGGGANLSGGSNTGGAGAYLTGTFAITPGVTYYILVGEGGRNAVSFGGGGNGASGGGACGGGGRSAVQSLTPTLTAVSGSGSVVTYTTIAPHGLVAGQAVTITGITTTTAYNGSYIVAGTPTPTTFTVTRSTTGTATFSSPTVYADIVCVGGGGGSASWGGKSGGTGAWTGTAGNGGSANNDTGGFGASQSAGGAGGAGEGGVAGTVLLGGTTTSVNCGGGGGGYYGGGSGGATSFNPGGGGGGSSYTALLTNATGANGVGGPTPPGTLVPGYITGVAAGSVVQGFGGNGLVIVLA